jgi:hypothetical protein
LTWLNIEGIFLKSFSIALLTWKPELSIEYWSPLLVARAWRLIAVAISTTSDNKYEVLIIVVSSEPSISALQLISLWAQLTWESIVLALSKDMSDVAVFEGWYFEVILIVDSWSKDSDRGKVAICVDTISSFRIGL